MSEKCILQDRDCINCGECDICDLDPNKRCDDCGKCIESDVDDYRSLNIQDFIKQHVKMDNKGNIKIEENAEDFDDGDNESVELGLDDNYDDELDLYPFEEEEFDLDDFGEEDFDLDDFEEDEADMHCGCHSHLEHNHDDHCGCHSHLEHNHNDHCGCEGGDVLPDISK